MLLQYTPILMLEVWGIEEVQQPGTGYLETAKTGSGQRAHPGLYISGCWSTWKSMCYDMRIEVEWKSGVQ
jgi:hypothetical protein